MARTRQSPRDLAISFWINRLWGISPDRQVTAQREIDSWNIRAVSEHLAGRDADAVVAAVMLAEAVRHLTDRGIAREKMLRKLRNDRDFWPTWAELRAAHLLSSLALEDGTFSLETDRSKGAHADFTFTARGNGKRISVEFKALGLADIELRFSQRAALLLETAIPRKGIVTIHFSDLEQVPPAIRGRGRRAVHRDARRRVGNLHEVGRGIAAAVVVGHGSENNYVQRLSSRFTDAFRQLTSSDDCYVAFYWTNGGPLSLVAESLSKATVPVHVAGVLLIGSVGIIGRMDNYLMVLPAPFQQEGSSMWHSKESEEDGKMVLGAVNDSGGVRPTFMRVPRRLRRFEFVRRCGQRRIDPFNLVLVRDPEFVSRTRQFGHRDEV